MASMAFMAFFRGFSSGRDMGLVWRGWRVGWGGRISGRRDHAEGGLIQRLGVSSHSPGPLPLLDYPKFVEIQFHGFPKQPAHHSADLLSPLLHGLIVSRKPRYFDVLL